MGYLTLLWDFAAEYAVSGDIGRYTAGVVSEACEWHGDADAFLGALIASGWLDRLDNGNVIIHDWPDHCENWVRAKAVKEGGFLDYYSLKSPLKDALKTASLPTTPCQALPSPANTNTLQGVQGVSSETDSAAETPPAKLSRSKSVFTALSIETLKDTSSLLEWWLWASSKRKPVVTSSDADRLRVVAAAERALEKGRDPLGLFASLVARRDWDKISEAQEERARKRLLDYSRTRDGPGDHSMNGLRELVSGTFKSPT